MLGLTGIVGRIATAVLYAVVTFIILLILAVIVGYFEAGIAAIINKFAALIAVLVGVIVFFTGRSV